MRFGWMPPQMEGEFKKADPVQALWIVDRLEKGKMCMFV